MNGGVSEYLISSNIFLSKTLNKVFQIIRDFVNKGSKFIGEHFHATATHFAFVKVDLVLV